MANITPTMHWADKLVPRYRRPYQVMHISGVIYTIQDLVQSSWTWVYLIHMVAQRTKQYDRLVVAPNSP